jgi:hypothetical protein
MLWVLGKYGPGECSQHSRDPAHRQKEKTVDEIRIPVAGDPFYAASLETV